MSSKNPKALTWFATNVINDEGKSSFTLSSFSQLLSKQTAHLQLLKQKFQNDMAAELQQSVFITKALAHAFQQHLTSKPFKFKQTLKIPKVVMDKEPVAFHKWNDLLYGADSAIAYTYTKTPTTTDTSTDMMFLSDVHIGTVQNLKVTVDKTNQLDEHLLESQLVEHTKIVPKPTKSKPKPTGLKVKKQSVKVNAQPQLPEPSKTKIVRMNGQFVFHVVDGEKTLCKFTVAQLLKLGTLLTEQDAGTALAFFTDFFCKTCWHSFKPTSDTTKIASA